MTKIRDIIKIDSGYTSYVDLHKEYFDTETNQARIKNYRPITAHRLAFEKIANAQNPKDRRFYFLSGSYGTGKSHLLLMLANYFATTSDLPEMERFFEQYADAQKQVLLKPGETLSERPAKSIKAARNSGRFLVAVCRFDLNLEFEGTVLRAVEEALQLESPQFVLDSQYHEALRRIRDWENRKTEARFYFDLENALAEHGGWTIGDMVNSLNNRDEDGLKVFEACFSVVTDTDFTFKKDNLQDILQDLLTNTDFKEQFKGIVILYDEFGYALDDGLVNLSRLHNFAQFCANSGMEHLPLIFIGTGHKSFRSHGDVGDKVHYETIEHRVEEHALQTRGMEDIISGVVHPLKEHPAWTSEVVPQAGVFTWFSNECKRLDLFNWLPAPKIKNNIIQGIYPMHPMATYALLRLAYEAGSDNRSIVKFFSPEFETGEDEWKNVQEYSYPWFVERHEIIENKKLSLYTADLLVDYFWDSLFLDNRKLLERIKTSIINYEATLRELNAYTAKKVVGKLFEESDELMRQITKIILVHEIISNEETPLANTLQNVQFSLHATKDQERTQIENRLAMLCKAGILFNDQGIYKLLPGDRKDIQRMVDLHRANPDNRPTDALDLFLTLKSLEKHEQFLDANDYNVTYNEDKRLKVVFVTPAQMSQQFDVLGKKVSYFSWLEAQRQETGYGKDGYEGTAVYFFCETDRDIDDAKKLLPKNDQDRVLVAVPDNPIKVFDPIFTLQALKEIQKSDDANSFGPLENVQISEIRNSAEEKLSEAKKAYFSNAMVSWFGVKGTSIPVQENKNYDVANWLMGKLYTGLRNTFPHKEFNRSHRNVSGQVLSILRDAGDILLDMSQTVKINWTWPDNRGGKLYLRKCFVDNQVLRFRNTEGDYRYFEPEKNNDKFREKLPAYAQMLKDLALLEGKGSTNSVEFLKLYFERYGQGEISITLALLMARRFYGDSLRFKREKDALTDLRFDSTDDMLKLVQGEYPNAVLLFEPVSEEDKAYFREVSRIFSKDPVSADHDYTLSDAFQAITSWWDGLPPIARSETFFEKKHMSFITALSQTQTKDPFNFIKYDLLDLLEILPNEKITKTKLSKLSNTLEEFKNAAENVLGTIQDSILEMVANIFNAQGSLDLNIREAIDTWYNDELTSIQKDKISPFHNNDSLPLISKINLIDIRKWLFETLPEAYGLNKVENWSTVLVDDYANKIERGKVHIEENAPEISELELTYDGYETLTGNKVTHKGELIIHASTNDGQGVIYYTDDGTDPSNTKSQRQSLKPGETLTVKGNSKVRLAVADEKGNYGTVTMVEAINELEKYKIKRPRQTTFGDPFVSFVFPSDIKAAKLTISSLFEALVKVVDPEELESLVLQILDELEG